MLSKFSPSWLLLGIILTYFGIGYLYASRTPAWQVPDEPAHYNYIRHIATEQTFPVLERGDYDEAYRAEIVSRKFPPELSIAPIEYEDHQPPLYYLLAAPLFSVTGGNVLALRLFSLVLGSGVIVFTYLAAREVAPPLIALTAAGFVAFVPQHVAMMAGVNNDALAELLMSLGLWLTLRASRLYYLGQKPWVLGIVLGLAFVTKSTIYPLAVISALMLALKARREHWRWADWLTVNLQVYVPALFFGALWWGRNLAVYGGLDFLGLQRHNEIVLGQLRTAEALAMWGTTKYISDFFQTTFQSFWGQFGWMGVVMDGRVYWALLVYSGVIGVGVLGAFVARGGDWFKAEERREAALLLALTLGLAVALYLYYNLLFVQFQGRYLYPALPVIALGAALGLRQWGLWARAHDLGLWLMCLAPIGLMAVLDVVALYRFVIPQLS